MTPIHVPQIDETASYECWLENGLLVMFHVIIERSWRNYQHDRDTPPDEICETEYINLKIDGLFNEDGEVDLPIEEIEELENKLLEYVPKYKE